MGRFPLLVLREPVMRICDDYDFFAIHQKKAKTRGPISIYGWTKYELMRKDTFFLALFFIVVVVFWNHIMRLALINILWWPYGLNEGLQTCVHSLSNTVECRYNAVQYSKVLHKLLQEFRQNINQMLDPQKTPHTSP